jgi:hypothetical protein
MSREITRSKTLIVGGDCELETVAVTLNYTYSGSAIDHYIKWNWGILKDVFRPSYQVNIDKAQGSVTLNFVRAKGQTIYLGNDEYIVDGLAMAGIPTCEGGVSINLSTFVITITGDGVINMALSEGEVY